MATKNLFTQNLTKSNKDIIASRAERFGKSAERSQRSLIDDLDQKLDKLENELEDLEDLSPNTQMSLQPIKGEFNTDAWTKRLQELQIAIANIKLEKEIAEKTFDKYFKVIK